MPLPTVLELKHFYDARQQIEQHLLDPTLISDIAAAYNDRHARTHLALYGKPANLSERFPKTRGRNDFCEPEVVISGDGVYWSVEDYERDSWEMWVGYEEWPFDPEAYKARTDVLVAEAEEKHKAVQAEMKRQEAEDKRQRKATEEMKERAEYERLKAKYGATEPAWPWEPQR